MLIAKGAPDTSAKGFLKAAFRKIGQKIALDTGDEIASNISTHVSNLFNSEVDSLLSKIPGFGGHFEQKDTNEVENISSN